MLALILCVGLQPQAHAGAQAQAGERARPPGAQTQAPAGGQARPARAQTSARQAGQASGSGNAAGLLGDTVRSGPVIFAFGEDGRALAEALAATAARTLPVLPADILEGEPPVIVQLAPDEASFDTLTGGRAPEWGAGVAFPAQARIVLPAYASRRGAVHELDRVLRHELAHVALQRYVGDFQVPRWFTEGYSTWAAGQLDTNAGWLLRLAFLTGRAPPLDSLTLDWPAFTTDARIAYLLSASVIGYLHDNGGDRVMRIFLERWREAGGFERALFDTYGLSLAQLEGYWSGYVRRRYGWLTFAAQSIVIWAFTGLLVIAMFILRRRHNRERMARLRSMELPDDPEYWVHTRQAWPSTGEKGGPAASDDGDRVGR